jgi:hypothetical protein
MGGKRGDSAKGTCSLTCLFSKRARAGELQQQPIAIDNDLVNDISGRKCSTSCSVVKEHGSEWIIVAKIAL